MGNTRGEAANLREPLTLPQHFFKLPKFRTSFLLGQIIPFLSA